jgi:hypothetical protein
MTILTKHRMAAIMGIIVGILTIIAGSKVLLGISSPNYSVLPWLVLYNVSLGAISLIAGIGLWNHRSWAILLSGVITALHSLIFIILFVMFILGKTVAFQSILAMLFRTTVWLGIFVVAKKNR